MIVRNWIYAVSAGIAAVGLTATVTNAEPQRTRSHAEWLVAGGDIENTHSARSFNGFNTATVRGLKPEWVFATAGDVSATPTIQGNSLFVPDWGGKLYRIDRKTGLAVWTRSMSDYTGIAASFSRNAPAITSDAIILGDQASGTVMSVSRQSGTLLWKTVVDPHPAAIITSSPTVFEGKVFVGVASNEEGLATTPGYKTSFRGSVAALDLNNGKIIWQLRTVPAPYTGGAVWGSSFAIDRRANALEIATGNNYTIPDAVRKCITSASALTQKIGCLAPNDYTDSVMSLSLETGAIRWTRRLEGPDVWTVNCVVNVKGGVPCPDPVGPDYDFGSAPNLFTIRVNGKPRDIVGAGQKSGMYWALDAETGETVWGTQVGPGGSTGGIEWGSATDGKRIYVAVNNSNHQTFTLAGTRKTWNAGSWAALDATTGEIEWQVPATGTNPIDSTTGPGALGSITTVNGVMLAGSMSGDMVALDGSNGRILWTYPTGGSVASGASVVGRSVYWGSGYARFGLGTANKKLFAFHLPD